jgi:dienelactone hydrolase
MARVFRLRPVAACLIAGSAILVIALGHSIVWGDSIVLKNGTVYRGILDKDDTLAFVSDNLKRTIFYNSKIDRVDSVNNFSKLERFAISQPLDVHVGVQPPAAVGIESTPWDDKGRRAFRYTNIKGKTVEMKQAIHEIGPYLTRFRGIDGFWQGQVATSQIPRPVILGLLARVKQDDQDERLKVTRWLIQAEWYSEALVALDGLVRDFPQDAGLRERVADTRRFVLELQARETLKEVEIRRKANQPLEALKRLREVVNQDLPKEIIDEARDQIRRDEDQAINDRLLADSLRDVAEKLSEADRKAWKVGLAEILEVLSQAPDAARPRLDAMIKADPKLAPESKIALAMSGWVVGPDSAVDNLKAAADLWHVRTIVHDYLASKSDSARLTLLADLQKVEGLELDTVAKIVVRMDPWLRDADPSKDKPGVVTVHRVAGDSSEVPSEYALLLPPEYHPSRSYPAVVALHDGKGPKAATDWLAAEAARRGYIVIAPEYNVPGMGTAYHYTSAEHAAVELSLRDARKRYSIDSDRVYLAGQLEGGNMAWDFGLAHPDVFAGVVVISGFPAKYVCAYKQQTDDVPMYIALGEMAPVAREIVFDQYVKPLILKVQDVTYVDYLKRGLEELPEEVPCFFDWMEKRKRDPVPKSFDAATARPGDARFFGVIVREIATGRFTAPEAAEPFGANLKPATIEMKSSVQGNLINITTTGINRLDVWVSPRLIDFKKKMEVRWNKNPLFKDKARLEFDPMLDDLRNRGDRQQLYYFKVVMGMGPVPKPRGR